MEEVRRREASEWRRLEEGFEGGDGKEGQSTTRSISLLKIYGLVGGLILIGSLHTLPVDTVQYQHSQSTLHLHHSIDS